VANVIEVPTLLYSISIPVIFFTAVGFFLHSYEKRERLRKKLEKRKQKIAQNEELRRETLVKINLMKPHAERIRCYELQIQGLVIHKAYYGKLNDEGLPIGENIENENSNIEQSPPEWIDVTIPLQSQVQNSQLILPEGTKERMVGFFNPVIEENNPNERKLSISYLFHDEMHKVTILDTQALSIPLRVHRLQQQNAPHC